MYAYTYNTHAYIPRSVRCLERSKEWTPFIKTFVYNAYFVHTK